jgi:hypothetical protein
MYAVRHGPCLLPTRHDNLPVDRAPSNLLHCNVTKLYQALEMAIVLENLFPNIPSALSTHEPSMGLWIADKDYAG